jgi:putative aldouronate transport system permease protein
MGIKSRKEKKNIIIVNVVLIFLVLLALIPFWLLISSSFSDEAAVTKFGYQFIPVKFSGAAYEYILGQWQQIGHAYLITIVVTVVGTTTSILMVSMFAYGLIQKNVPGIKVITILVLISMLFSGGIVPTYYVYTNILHVKNTIWGLILPNLLMNAFNVILVKNYFGQNIPGELLEAAEMDGAGPFHILFRIVMPLSKPILATVGLLTGVSYWNDWNNGLYYINDTKLYSVQQMLNEMNQNIQFLANNASKMVGISVSKMPSATARMAIAVVAILPILAAYPFFQKYFVKGITVGAVKG